MTLDNVTNFGLVQASTGYNASVTSIVLQSGQGSKLPAAPFNLVWYNSTDYPNPAADPQVEIVRCTLVSTDTLTIARAQEGTSASTKNTAGKTYSLTLGITAKMITDIQALAGGGTPVDGEVVAGSGTSFTLANIPPVAGSVKLYASGTRLNVSTSGAGGGNNDYNINYTTGVITTVASYAAGTLIADYRK